MGCSIVNGQGVCPCKDNPGITNCKEWGPVCGPNGNNKCSENGVCVFNDGDEKYSCDCLEGYDGEFCENWAANPCNVPDACPEDATKSCSAVLNGDDEYEAFCDCHQFYSPDGKCTIFTHPCDSTPCFNDGTKNCSL